MMRKLTPSQADDRGFSLIEMVVVVLIVSVLAAIAIPFFLEQRERSYEAQTAASLKDASTAMKSYATRNDGSYPPVGLVPNGPPPHALISDHGFRTTASVPIGIAEIDNAAGTFCLEANHDNLADNWSYDSDDGAPKRGAC